MTLNSFLQRTSSIRSFAGLGRTLMAALLLASLATPVAGGSREFYPEARSALRLSVASGSVGDLAVNNADPSNPWDITGTWRLGCVNRFGRRASCSAAPLNGIFFDMVLNMVQQNGSRSHSHSFKNFVATSADVDPATDTLTITGDIQGTFPMGDSTIVLEIINVSRQDSIVQATGGKTSTFCFTMPTDSSPVDAPNTHLNGSDDADRRADQDKNRICGTVFLSR